MYDYTAGRLLRSVRREATRKHYDQPWRHTRALRLPITARNIKRPQRQPCFDLVQPQWLGRSLGPACRCFPYLLCPRRGQNILLDPDIRSRTFLLLDPCYVSVAAADLGSWVVGPHLDLLTVLACTASMSSHRAR